MARDFDGTDDQINYPNNSQYDLTGDFTIFCWFTVDDYGLDDGTNFPALLAARDSFSTVDWQIYYHSAVGQKCFRFGYTNSLTKILFDANGWKPTTGATTWHSIAITRETNSFVLYGDGVSRDSESSTNAMTTGESITIGTLENGIADSLYSWDGKIAHVLLLDGIALSSTKIAALHRASNLFLFSNGSSGNLAFYAPLYGNKSPEDNYAKQTTDGDITGATKAAHNPPVELLENYL